jgi:hypothetical protein
MKRSRRPRMTLRNLNLVRELGTTEQLWKQKTLTPTRMPQTIDFVDTEVVPQEVLVI